MNLGSSFRRGALVIRTGCHFLSNHRNPGASVALFNVPCPTIAEARLELCMFVVFIKC